MVPKPVCLEYLKQYDFIYSKKYVYKLKSGRKKLSGFSLGGRIKLIFFTLFLEVRKKDFKEK